MHPGGAQSLFGVTPDLTTLGKVIGGGLPIGAYGGRADIMSWVAPEGPVYQAGTLSGNPVAVRAGLATLDLGLNKDMWAGTASQTALLMEELASIATRWSVPMQVNGLGTMFSCFFTDAAVTDWTTASTSDTDLFAKIFNAMLKYGVHLAPSQYEAWFMSSAHDAAAVTHTLHAFDKALKAAVG